MPITIQPIHRAGRVVALVIDGAAVISEHIDADELVHVQAMALYAIKVAAGEITGLYTDAGAEHYATRALARARTPIAPPPRLRCRRRPRR